MLGWETWISSPMDLEDREGNSMKFSFLYTSYLLTRRKNALIFHKQHRK
jgi:hypothetical protein